MALSEIDFIGKYDFTKGFQSFHIMWPLDDLSHKESKVFETPLKYGDKSVSFSWNLAIQKSTNDSGKEWFGLRCQTAMRQHKAIPATYRFSLSSSIMKNSEVSGGQFFAIFTRSYSYGMTISPQDLAAFPHGKAVFHCWLAIPTAAAIESNTQEWNQEPADSVVDYATPELTKQAAFIANIGSKFPAVMTGEDKTSDITLIVSESENARFHCHRVLLSAASPVFSACFANEGQWKENSERAVQIGDIDGQTMEIILKHIYSAYLPEKSTAIDQLSKIIYAADKYDLSILKNWCASIMISQPSNTLTRVKQLEIADKHGLDQLKAICMQQMSFNLECWGSAENLDGIPGRLLSEIVRMCYDREYKAEEIVLSGAQDEDGQHGS